MNDKPDPKLKIDFSQVFEGISKVKLRGGVVGRVCWVLIFSVVSIVLVVWAAVAFPAALWISALGLVAIVLLVFTFLNRIITFADKNPEAALLEGAEFIKLEQIRFGMKSTPMLPASDAAEVVAAKQVTINAQEVALPDAKTDDSSQLPNG